MPDALTSTASRPALVTTRDRPSEGRDGLDMHLIWVRPEQKYFCKRGWTGHFGKNEMICPTGENQPPFALRATGDTAGLSAAARRAKAAGVSGRFRIRDWRRMGTPVSSWDEDA